MDSPPDRRATVATPTTHYEYITLSGKVMRQSWDGNVIDFIYDENNQPFAMRYKASGSNNYATYYYILNVQGDVIGLLNANGAIAAKYTYDPWGKVTVQSSNGTANTSSAFIGNINPLRYRGYYYDNDTGLYYLQSRYYDPAIGRFINADAFASTDTKDLLGTNMFAYCENNPINNHDSSGDFCIASAIVGGVLNAGLAVAGAYIDSFISGVPVNTKDMAIDVIVAFASGAIQGGFGRGVLANAMDVLDVAWTFGTTVARGGTLEEALARSAVTLVTVKAGKSFDKHLGDGAADKAMGLIGGAGLQAGVNILEDTADITINTINESRNASSTRPQKTSTREVRIHALCAC